MAGPKDGHAGNGLGRRGCVFAVALSFAKALDRAVRKRINAIDIEQDGTGSEGVTALAKRRKGCATGTGCLTGISAVGYQKG